LTSPITQFDVWRVSLDPVLGSEMAKVRPCVIVSRNEVNSAVRTVVIVPLTSTVRKWPFRQKTAFDGVEGDCAIDHIRAVDKSRLVKRLGQLNELESRKLAAFLAAFFVPNATTTQLP
jgi:mRNA interferase MazF